MELCQRTLKHYLDERHAVDRIENLVIFLQIVSALRYMHRMHLLHRDIKSNNIFIDYRCQLVPPNTLRSDDDSDSDENDIGNDDEEGNKRKNGLLDVVHSSFDKTNLVHRYNHRNKSPTLNRVEPCDTMPITFSDDLSE
uniref:Putative serine/threonine-protein kinase zyg-1 n=1 Tax=Lygus hesperus TaxID=30085 RepID=A0A0A9YWX9_LYGHE